MNGILTDITAGLGQFDAVLEDLLA
jgi:hypothetical protein